MAKFLEGNDLNAAIGKVFEESQNKIILISPYIKLHERFKSSLLTKINNANIKLTVLFGKNEVDKSKSMRKSDFDFFKEFPNIEIRYEKRLHAKYYANENKEIFTSMNLYDYSQNNNIEVGVLIEKSLKSSFTGKNVIDTESSDYFNTVLNQADLLFLKEPVFEKEKKLLSSSQVYVTSQITCDKLSEFFSDIKKAPTKAPVKAPAKQTGYCIRSGNKIPFDVNKPFDKERFKIWNEYKDSDYPEKYCHYSGVLSNGKTSFNKPILSVNYKEAMNKHKFTKKAIPKSSK